MENKIAVKRIYDSVCIEEDGKRILVDRLWPRGISKDAAKLDYWMREIAPSTELRKWYKHESAKFDEFKVQYIKELSEDVEKKQKVEELLDILRSEKITLLYGAKDQVNNQAVVLKEFLLGRV